MSDLTPQEVERVSDRELAEHTHELTLECAVLLRAFNETLTALSSSPMARMMPGMPKPPKASARN